MAPVRLELEFKGARDYAHGTDIYNGMNRALVEKFGMLDISDIRFSIHRMTSSHLDLLMLPDSQLEAGSKPVALMSFQSGARAFKLVAVEAGIPIVTRRPYSEEAVEQEAVFDRDGATLRVQKQLAYSDIELWVSQNKILLQRLFTDRQGKWLFVKSEFDRYSYRTWYRNSNLRLLHNFNFRFTKSEVIVDEVLRGFIYFSMT
jgi:hypothetical protein